ncbi:MAG: hypothetical protein HKN58_04970, partial [Xanthomonadales bacterium]|nr:hypothetical protein [Xanthomonadales bacterium]
AQQGRYDTGHCRPADGERYRFHYRPEIDAATGFTLVATPTEPQQGDACGWLSIDELGLQSVQNEDAAACWSGRSGR